MKATGRSRNIVKADGGICALLYVNLKLCLGVAFQTNPILGENDFASSAEKIS